MGSPLYGVHVLPLYVPCSTLVIEGTKVSILQVTADDIPTRLYVIAPLGVLPPYVIFSPPRPTAIKV